MSPKSPLHVLVADSAQLRSQLLTTALGRRPGFHVSQCLLDSAHILEAARSQPVDVVLADVERHEELATELQHLRHVHLLSPRLRIVLLVSSYNRELVTQAFRSGVRGLFCFSTDDFRALCKCLQCVQRGQVWANSEQLGMVLESLGQSDRKSVV